jgi:sensor histidine kinase YesM
MQHLRWRRVTAYIGIWILAAFAFSGLLYFSTVGTLPPEKTIGWQLILTWQAIIYGWAILFPLIHLFVKKFPFERQKWLRETIAYCVIGFLFIVAHTVIYAGLYEIIHGTFFREQNVLSRIQFLFLRNWVLDASTFGMILGLIFAYDYYHRFHEEQIKSAELKSQLANSQLQTLKMQLHPHFLFNTLNSISALIHEDARAADKMVARLGEFLRLTLDNSGEQEVPLRKEIDFLNRYLEIESIRFEDRLFVKKDIEPETLDACVPNLILQPIIENAIRHGISKQIETGVISISARRIGGRLLIRIEDNGPGLNSAVKATDNGKGGIGLANTSARLLHLYGENHSLKISNAEPTGVQVTLEIPFKISKTESAEAEVKNGNGKISIN